jgi:carbonic anhydrase
MADHGRILRAFIMTFIVVSFLAAQQPSNTEAPKHWGYTDENGAVPPSDWGTLPGDDLCKIGHQESPINLSSKVPAEKTAGPKFEYHPTGLSIVNNGHTVQMNTDPGSAITVNGKSYKLAQFHFHAPSEHTVDGKHYPLEIHLVHLNDAGQPAAVVGIMVRAGKPNPALDAAMSQLPEEQGKPVQLKGPVDLSSILPASGGFWHYPGSLTTPPCTEGIQWFVMESSIEMSRQQISSFTSLPEMGETARPVQEIGDRKVERLARQ